MNKGALFAVIDTLTGEVLDWMHVNQEESCKLTEQQINSLQDVWILGFSATSDAGVRFSDTADRIRSPGWTRRSATGGMHDGVVRQLGSR